MQPLAAANVNANTANANRVHSGAMCPSCGANRSATAYLGAECTGTAKRWGDAPHWTPQFSPNLTKMLNKLAYPTTDIPLDTMD